MSDGAVPVNPAPVEEFLSWAVLTEVLYDQLDYLVNHKHEDVAEDTPCPDCARLGEVRDILLRPFKASNTRSIGQAA